MSSKNIFYSSDYANDEHVGLFDRIINIKFTRKNGETITLHSDYEPVWQAGELHFVTCQPKPEIRVKYTQYQGALIDVDIFVTNFVIQENPETKTKDAQIQASARMAAQQIRQGENTNQPNDALTMHGNPIIKAEIEMGYRGDFYNWSRYDRSVASAEKAYRAFQDLEGLEDKSSKITSSQLLFRKHRRCVITITWAVNISNPPDRVTQFHGYVGSSEAGFQPFVQPVLDSPAAPELGTGAGTTGRLTIFNLFSDLNDTYDLIDQVRLNEAGYEDKTNKDLVFSYGKIAFRNFFNGGKGFTLLEALCFHLLTRRFVRTNIDVKRNSNLEKAYLEIVLSTQYSPKVDVAIANTYFGLQQAIYERESRFYPEFFALNDTGDFIRTAEMPENFHTFLDKILDELLIDRFIGARYTIKNLPEHRLLYTAIRKTMTKAAKEQKYLTWWDAADEIDSSDYSATKTVQLDSLEFKDTVESCIDYVLKLYAGSLNPREGVPRDCFFKRTFSDDWIIPLVSLQSSVLLEKTKIKTPKKRSGKKAAPAEGAEQDLPCFTGLFEIRDAYMFGVPVLCSEKASRVVAEKLKKSTFIEAQFFSQIDQQIAWICRTYGLLFSKLNNGGFQIYTPAESTREVSGQDSVKAQSRKPIVIPAIYDLTLSPIRKMRLPFIGFLDPMTLLEWNSSSTVGSLVSFFYQTKKGRNFFLNISNTIDFSTTGEYNLMELSLVDTAWAEPKKVLPALTKDEIKDAKGHSFVSILIIPDDLMDSWRKIYECEMSVIPPKFMSLWVPTSSPYSYPSEDGRVSPEQFFTAMSTWNETLFSLAKKEETGWGFLDYDKRVDKQANKLYGKGRPDENVNFPDIEYCLTLPDLDDKLKRVYMKFPIMPSVDDYNSMIEVDKDRIMVYHDRQWTMELKSDMKKIYNIEVV